LSQKTKEFCSIESSEGSLYNQNGDFYFLPRTGLSNKIYDVRQLRLKFGLPEAV
jgi:hypothetical protein